MYAGDMARNGVQDNAVNLCDIMVLAKSFNTRAGNARYSSDADINKDSEVNMSDVFLVADYFNTTPDIYPDDVTPLPGILYINTIGMFSIDVAFSRSLQIFDKNDFSIDSLTIQDANSVTDYYYGLGKSCKNVIHIITCQPIPERTCKLIFDGQEYEFTFSQGMDTALGAIKLDGLTAQYIKDDHSQVMLSWEPLTLMQRNSIFATGYEILCCSTDDIDCTNPVTIPITDVGCTSLLINGLNINKEYKFAICASNRTAKSPPSKYVTASNSAPLPISKPIEVNTINNNEIAIVFDNEVSNYGIDDFYIYADLKVNNVKPMNGNKNILILSTSNQVPGYTYTIFYKNKVCFTFTGSGLKPSDFKADTLNKKTVYVTLGTELSADSFKGNEFTMRDLKGNLLNIISTKPDELDVLRKTVLLTLASDMNEGITYTLMYGTNSVNFTLDTIDIEKPYLKHALEISETEVELEFSEPIDYLSAKFEFVGNYGSKKAPQVTGIRYGGRSAVLLTVSKMSISLIYELSISNVTDLAGNMINPTSTMFPSMSDNNPTATFDHPDALKIVGVQSCSPDKIVAQFTSSLDPDTAILSNFKISEVDGAKTPLTISSVRLAKKGDTSADGIEFTSDEIAGMFAILSVDSCSTGVLYRLETRNIYSSQGKSISLSGNISTFVGNGSAKKSKISKITYIEYADNSDTEIIVSFDQNLGSNATDVSHYTINNDVGHPSKAEAIPDERNKVKLTIPKLEPGKIYRLTVENLENSDGVLMDSPGIFSKLVGNGSQVLPQMVNATSIDNQTLNIRFNMDVRNSAIDGSIWNSRTNKLVKKALSYVTDFGMTCDLESYDAYVCQDPNDQCALIVRVNSSIAYKLVILKLIGDPLKFAAGSNEQQFFATTNDPAEILVKNVVALNSTTVRVYFNMPVYGSLDKFADINIFSHYGESRAITLSNPTAVDDTYKVYDFKLSHSLEHMTYQLNLNPAVDEPNTIIKDTPAAFTSYVGMKDEDDSTPGCQQSRQFAGILPAPGDINDITAVMINDKTIKIYYPTSMNQSDVINPSNYLLVDAISGNTPVKMGAQGVDFSPAIHISDITYSWWENNTATITLNTRIMAESACMKFSTSIRDARLTSYVKNGTESVCKQFTVSSIPAGDVKINQAYYNSINGILTIEMNQLFKTTTNITSTDAQELLDGIKITLVHNNGSYSICPADISEVKAFDSSYNPVDSFTAYAQRFEITLTQAVKEKITTDSIGRVEITAPNNFIGINGNYGNTDTYRIFIK